MSLFARKEDLPEQMKGRVIVTGETLMMQIVTEVPKPGGEEVPPHRHNEEQLGYILEGECELEIETNHPPAANWGSCPDKFIGQPSEKRILKAGDFFRIPAGALHRLKIIGNKPVSWIAAYHPIRPDYLPKAVRLESKHKPLPFK
ncbi:MAG: cupin domain-containing protein [Candidatus Bathyarchaeia archaeon]